jgi:alkylhydroperoxidase family enzyme
MTARYVLRLRFEWEGGCLWCVNDAARQAFDVGAIEDRLPLTPETIRRLDELTAWHDTALDWDDPAGPGPWPPDEYARFDQAAAEVLESIRAQLGPDFQVDYALM